MNRPTTVSGADEGAAEAGAAPAAGRAVVPCRACLSGEDLDWLGGRSVSLALDLTTSVTVRPPAARPPTGAATDDGLDCSCASGQRGVRRRTRCGRS
ncbi:hypothetical protein ACWEQ8_34055, partial [Streptomyces noursei]